MLSVARRKRDFRIFPSEHVGIRRNEGPPLMSQQINCIPPSFSEGARKRIKPKKSKDDSTTVSTFPAPAAEDHPRPDGFVRNCGASHFWINGASLVMYSRIAGKRTSLGWCFGTPH
jgi:hypothetical protein